MVLKVSWGLNNVVELLHIFILLKLTGPSINVFLVNWNRDILVSTLGDLMYFWKEIIWIIGKKGKMKCFPPSWGYHLYFTVNLHFTIKEPKVLHFLCVKVNICILQKCVRAQYFLWLINIFCRKKGLSISFRII